MQSTGEVQMINVANLAKSALVMTGSYLPRKDNSRSTPRLSNFRFRSTGRERQVGSFLLNFPISGVSGQVPPTGHFPPASSLFQKRRFQATTGLRRHRSLLCNGDYTFT